MSILMLPYLSSSTCRLLLDYLRSTLRRESAAECLHEIVSKGMEPLPKIDLVESLDNRLRNMSILSATSEQVEM